MPSFSCLMISHIVENRSGITVDLDFIHKVCNDTGLRCEVNQSISVLLTNNTEIQDLNIRFRGVDSPTDVLTFPSGLGLPFPIGDIAISVEYADQQAKMRGATLDHEIAALVIHGILHLKGFDDETEADKKIMQAEMQAIGEEFSIPIDAAWTSILHQEQA